MKKSQENSPLPQHIGFIVDGNRRWARERGLPTLEGHRKGFKKVEMVAETVLKSGVSFVSFFLFSTENWQRSPEEVSYLMELANNQVLKLARKLAKQNYRCLILGRREPIDDQLWQKLKTAEEITKDCTAGTVAICFNYGGQQEIIDAVNQLPQDQIGKLSLEDFQKFLYQPSVPPVDLIVRTSGEQRISGFMLWRAAYSEFLFLKKYFPSITKLDLTKIFKEYQNRQRRFGK